MGAGIAAHVANAGVPVVLLDIVPAGDTDRDALAKGAIEKLEGEARRVPRAASEARHPGNLEDHPLPPIMTGSSKPSPNG
jgi:3-hydroxyacyl-CoA dehydrogenase